MGRGRPRNPDFVDRHLAVERRVRSPQRKWTDLTPYLQTGWLWAEYNFSRFAARVVDGMVELRGNVYLNDATVPLADWLVHDLPMPDEFAPEHFVNIWAPVDTVNSSLQAQKCKGFMVQFQPLMENDPWPPSDVLAGQSDAGARVRVLSSWDGSALVAPPQYTYLSLDGISYPVSEQYEGSGASTDWNEV